MQIRKYGIKFQRINHILISHLHGDHFFGLVGLISTMHLMGRDKGLSIYGPEELEQILRLQLEVGAAKLDFEINFVKLNGKDSGVIFEDKLIQISYFPLKHRIPTNGFVIREKVKERRLNPLKIEGSGLQFEHMHRLKKGEDILLENGKTLKNTKYTLDPHPSFSYAYCSDTAYAEKIVSYIKGVSLLYHEATFIEKDIERARATFHSTARQAAEIAKKAGVGKLLVGHLSARYESTSDHLHEAMHVFENSEVVEDGRTYQVS
jgi:ribonuclease Z